MGTLGRRLGALTVLLAGTIGAPVGLWVFGGTLIPDRAPTLAQVWVALSTPDNGRTLAAVMLLAATTAWVVFTGCVLLELAACLTRRRTLRLPGLRWPQTAAAALIGLVLAGTIVVTSPTPAVADPVPKLPSGPVAASTYHPSYGALATIPAPVGAPVTSPAGTAAPTGVGGPEWTVRKGDTLWAIADRTLGDPLRYPEIVTLNTHRVQPDGRTLTSADWLEIGWTLQLPADAHTTTSAGPADPASGASSSTVVVAAGDTLSGIAADHHTDTATMWAANAHRPEPGRAAFTDPDLIHPGWTLTIPAPTPATTADVAPATHPADPPPAGGPAQPVTPAAPAAAAPGEPVTPAAPAAAAPAEPVTPTNAEGSVPVPETAPASPAPAADPRTATHPDAGPATAGGTESTAGTAAAGTTVTGVSPAVWMVGTAGAALLAGGLVMTLRGLRRRQFRHRRPGRVITPTPPPLVGLERTVVTAGTAASLDVAFLDEALRALHHHTQHAKIGLPDVIAARLTPTELHLTLHRPSPTPAAPWQANDDGSRWTLARADHVPPTAVIVGQRPRKGAVTSARGAGKVLADAIAAARRVGVIGCRLDSAFYNH